MERELTALEQRLYKFLDDVDSLTEFDLTPQKWTKIREYVNRCKDDCKVQYGVVNNGYSLHIKLPFEFEPKVKAINESEEKCEGRDI